METGHNVVPALPSFYRPIVCQDMAGYGYRVVDGGLLSNFPVGIFDVMHAPAYPTLGLRLVDAPPIRKPPVSCREENLWQFGQDLLNTMLTAHDRLYLDEHSAVRTISIPVNGISGTHFALSRAQIEQLYQNGERAAEGFFASWNFADYKALYRT